MTPDRDPTTMTVRERVAEIGMLLAAAHRRVRAKRESDEKVLGEGGSQTAHVLRRERDANGVSEIGAA